MEEVKAQLPADQPEPELPALSFREKLKANKGKVLGGVLGALIFAGAIFGAYKLGQRQAQLPLQPTPTPAAVATPTPDPTADWQTYTINNASFKYPSTWEIIDQIPEEYKAKGFREENWEKSKMFVGNCSGPIIQNTQVRSTIIAVEVVETGSAEGGFCWSNGDFTDTYTRTIASLKSPQTIDVIKWKLGKYEEEGVEKIIQWQGDLFQSYDFNKQFKEDKDKPWLVFALVYQEGKDALAESTFDLMLSTFRFLEEEVSWVRRKFNNIWDIAIPEGWRVDEAGLTEGALRLEGLYKGSTFSVRLAYPMFLTEKGPPSSLTEWIGDELSTIPEEKKDQVRVVDAVIAGVESKKVYNFPEKIFDDGKTRRYSENLTNAAYIWKQEEKNMRLVFVIQVNGEKRAGSMDELFDRFVEGIR